MHTRPFTIRLTDAEREMFEQAAALTDRSTGKLILHCARPGAQAIVAQAEAEGAAPNNI